MENFQSDITISKLLIIGTIFNFAITIPRTKWKYQKNLHSQFDL